MTEGLYRLRTDSREQILNISKALLDEKSSLSKSPLRIDFISDCVNGAGRLGLLSSTDWLDWLEADPVGTLRNLIDHLEEVST